jgi:hypothetical protein
LKEQILLQRLQPYLFSPLIDFCLIFEGIKLIGPACPGIHPGMRTKSLRLVLVHPHPVEHQGILIPVPLIFPAAFPEQGDVFLLGLCVGMLKDKESRTGCCLILICATELKNQSFVLSLN